MRAELRAMPTMLRVGLAETIAYRAEMVVWILTTTMPLVMLALWSSVADEAPFRQYTQTDFVAYYLGALIVRNLTSNWVAWQLSEEIRLGTLSMRLLRPVHPFASFLATHLAALPLRALVVTPAIVILVLTEARAVLIDDAGRAGLLALSLAGAWLLTFGVFLAIGALAFFLEKSLALIEVYFGVFMLMSGYIIPLDLMPGWMRTTAEWLPFRYMLGAPVELLIGRYPDAAAAAPLVATQWAWAIGMLGVAGLAWRAGVRRFEAYGA
ncbi:MAG: ABC-2 family transporter protein [Kofleriaceae bacterium]|nr:ABC-2 family transporter protein [Kofleriaceae bacterium]MCL4228180.1 ABC-2 family transporter protein [Myxococcales bacterium]